jgi:antitoxin component of MazEF toxin-antitoxin module
MEQFKVAKWGNSLAVRLPSKWAKRLGIEEGDVIPSNLLMGSTTIRARLEAERESRKMTREESTTAIRKARKLFPKNLKPQDWKIDRSDPDMRG